jgi:hypothetical protein
VSITGFSGRARPNHFVASTIRAVKNEKLQTILALRAEDINVAAIGIALQMLRHERNQDSKRQADPIWRALGE